MSSLDIYKMELHEVIHFQDKGMQVTRVPSGWIYELTPYNGFNGGITFVPYDNFFQETST